MFANVFGPGTKYVFPMPDSEKLKPKYCHAEHVMNCCGIDWIAGFPHPARRDGVTWMNSDEVDNKHLVENLRSDVQKILKNGTANSVMLVALNHIQNRIYKDMLAECGFKPILENAYHSGHGHTLFIYAWKKYERTTPTSNS